MKHPVCSFFSSIPRIAAIGQFSFDPAFSLTKPVVPNTNAELHLKPAGPWKHGRLLCSQQQYQWARQWLYCFQQPDDIIRSAWQWDGLFQASLLSTVW